MKFIIKSTEPYLWTKKVRSGFTQYS